MTGPFSAEVKRLQQKISNLTHKEQMWSERLYEKRSVCKSVRARIKLLCSKSRLNEKIRSLIIRLQRERDQGLMASLRSKVKESDERNAELQNTVEMLSEQLKIVEGNSGPEWLYLLHKDNRASPRTPFP